MMSEPGVHVIHSDNRDLSPQEYADANDVTLRTVRRWLADGELPGAWQDAITQKWNIPATAERTLSSTPRPPQQPRPTVVFPGQAHGLPGELVLHQPAAAPVPEREPTRLEDLDDETSFLSIAAAAEYLGIPQESILEQPEVFGVLPVGRKLPDGTRVRKVPKAAIKKFEGS